MLFAVSDVVWQALIGAAVTLVLARMAQRAARKVEEVKTTLSETTKETDKKLDSIARVGEMTHDLCNSAMLEQKRMHMVKCEAAAQETPSAVNIAEARVAKETYDEHKSKQEQMDAKSKVGAT